eukprot:TRINITY_DN11629_c0_g1_i1.p1 TRINITY_DN11629_c0_g1~~TRINITY_DN11629_c0_g1_i1.p1  ORF type:complete len:732 (+),score=169.95 TRINITY_DN11629_c0_g1_i1:95-2290(+)
MAAIQTLLAPLVTQIGVASPALASRLVELMKSSHCEDIISRGAVCAAIKSTKRPDVLQALVDQGVLPVLNAWLSDSSISAVVLNTILESMKNLPVTIETMQVSGIGKTVKAYKKHTDPTVQNVASDLINNWTKLVERRKRERDEPTGSAPSAAVASPRKPTSEESLPKVAKTAAPKRSLKPDYLVKQEKRQPIRLVNADAVATPAAAATPAAVAATPAAPAPVVSTTPVIPALAVTPPSPAEAVPNSKLARPTSVLHEPLLSVPHEQIESPPVNKKKWRRVSFPDEDKIRQVREFEKDDKDEDDQQHESLGSFANLQKHEHEREREALLQLSKHQSDPDESMEAQMEWSTPQLCFIPVRSDEDQFTRGQNSEERRRFAETERRILAAVYISESQIPPCPTEPTEPVIVVDLASIPRIPLDDEQTVAHKREQMRLAAQVMSTAVPTAAAGSLGLNPALQKFLNIAAPPVQQQQPPVQSPVQQQQQAPLRFGAQPQPQPQQPLRYAPPQQQHQQQPLQQAQGTSFAAYQQQQLQPMQQQPGHGTSFSSFQQQPQQPPMMMQQPQQIPQQVPHPQAQQQLNPHIMQMLVAQLVANPTMLNDVLAQARNFGIDEPTLINALTRELNSAQMLQQQQQQQQQAPIALLSRPASGMPALQQQQYRERSPGYTRAFDDRDRDRDRRSPPRGAINPAGARRVCAFFNGPVGCRNGASCPWVHDPTSKPDPDLQKLISRKR